MRFGVSVSGLSPKHYASIAEETEELGYESVWVPDHLIFPETLPATYLYTDDGKAPISATTAVYDPWVLLGAMAAVTETLRFGTNVYVLPLRHPVITARGVLTVDRISRGRITLGVGVGWLREEFDIVGEDPTTRGRRADEIIPLLRRLWSEEVVEHHGEFIDLPPVRFEPKPFQKPIPIEVGGTSARALRRAGTLGDGWIEIGSRDIAELEEHIRTIKSARIASGRQNRPFIMTGGIDPAGTNEYIDTMARLGFGRLVLNVPSSLERSEISGILRGCARRWSLPTQGSDIPPSINHSDPH